MSRHENASLRARVHVTREVELARCEVKFLLRENGSGREGDFRVAVLKRLHRRSAPIAPPVQPLQNRKAQKEATGPCLKGFLCSRVRAYDAGASTAG
jgi:hypothetical protein